MHHPAFYWFKHKFRQTLTRLGGNPIEYSGLPSPVFESKAATVSCRPALFDPDHLSRVTSCAFGQTVPQLAKVLSADHYVEAPLARYELGNATLAGGMLFRKDSVILHSTSVQTAIRDVFAGVPVTDEAIVANSMQGLRYFGHWLGDDVSAFEAYRDHPGLTSLPLPAWGDMPVYTDLFDQTWKQQPIIRSRSLSLLRDLGFSRAKAARYHNLREKLRSGLGASRCASQIIYLRRGRSGARREIINEIQLETRLSDAGIKIVTPENFTPDLLSSIVDASVIISVEGSQARHAIYTLKDAGGLIVLQPPDRFYAAPHEWMRSLDMRCGIVIGTSIEGGFVIDPDEVLRMTDRLLKLSENQAAAAGAG